MWIRMREMGRCCGFSRGVRTGESICLSIGMAAWLTAHNSEAGAAANGATTTTAGAEDGKAKSARRENERGRDKTDSDPSQFGTLQSRDSGDVWDSWTGPCWA